MKIQKKTKIVYIISYIDKAIAFEWISERLNPEKFDLSFILLNATPSYLAGHLEKNGTWVKELVYRGKKDILKVSVQVFNLLRKLKPDVIHTHLLDADLIGLSVGRLLGVKKRVYTRHNANYNKKYHKGAEKFDRWNNANCTHIASISQNVSDILVKEEGVAKSKIRLVYHGFDLERFGNVQKEELSVLLKKYNPEKKDPVIGVISRYMHWKGIQYIIPAFKALLKDYPDAYLILANAKKGDYKEEIHNMLLELPENSFQEIEFEHNLFALYHLFDIFVHVPIDEEVEAFGQIYVEALAAGIPSVVTKSGIARELIRHEENALTVDFQNTQEIHHAIKLLLENEMLRKKLILNGQNSVQEKFSLDNMIQTLEALYVE